MLTLCLASAVLTALLAVPSPPRVTPHALVPAVRPTTSSAAASVRSLLLGVVMDELLLVSGMRPAASWAVSWGCDCRHDRVAQDDHAADV